MAVAFEQLKHYVGKAVSSFVESTTQTTTFYLPKGPLDSSLKAEGVVRSHFERLSTTDKNQVHGKVWELAKMEDPRIQGLRWGEEHAFDNIERLAKAMQRLGFLGQDNIHPIPCLSFEVGEGGLGAQYFSLGEKLGKDPSKGQIGFVNGMGIPTLEHAGKDAADLSKHFVDGCNVHTVYNSTHQRTASGDTNGYVADVIRMKAIDGGSYTKTSYLIAQQWIDFLDANPGRNYLQFSISEGAVHTNAALRLIDTARPDLMPRIRVLALCPGHFILPDTFTVKPQIRNFVKLEDNVILPWAANADKIGTSEHIVIVPHTGGHPHNGLTEDYQQAARTFIQEFMRSGNIL